STSISSLFPYTTLFRSVVDDGLLDDGRADDVVHLLRHHYCLAEILSDRLIKILYIGSHIRRSNRLPSLFNYYHLSDTLQTAHLRSEEHTSELQSRFDLV